MSSVEDLSKLVESMNPGQIQLAKDLFWEHANKQPDFKDVEHNLCKAVNELPDVKRFFRINTFWIDIMMDVLNKAKEEYESKSKLMDRVLMQILSNQTATMTVLASIRQDKKEKEVLDAMIVKSLDLLRQLGEKGV